MIPHDRDDFELPVAAYAHPATANEMRHVYRFKPPAYCLSWCFVGTVGRSGAVVSGGVRIEAGNA